MIKNTILAFADNALKLLLLCLSLLVLLDLFGVSFFHNNQTLLIVFLLSFFVLILKDCNKLIKQLKTQQIVNKFALFFLAGVGLYFLYFVLFNYGNPFQYKREVNPNKIKSFQVLDGNNSRLEFSFTPVLNHLGAFELFFRPIQQEEMEQYLTLEEKEEQLEHITAEVIFENYLVEVYADNELVHSYIYGIPTFPEPHVYPIGFPTDVNSKHKSYRIVIERVSDFPPMQAVAVKNNSLWANPHYVVPKSQLFNYGNDLIEFLLQKTKLVLEVELIYLMLLVLAVLSVLYYCKEHQKKRVVIAALVNLVFYYLLFVLDRIGLETPIMVRQFSSLASLFTLAYTFYLHRERVVVRNEEKVSLHWLDWLFIATSCGIFFGFATHHLGQFMSVDEPKWLYTRVPQLYNSLRNLDFAGTYINDKPGIIPSYLAGIVNFFTSYSNYGPTTREIYLFYWRLPIVVFNTLLLPLVYWLSCTVFNKKVARLYLLLLVTFPHLVGISQLVNPDATLWSLGLLAVLFFLKYIKFGKPRDSTWSGIFLGLALLSKFFAALYYFGFFFLIYYLFISNEPDQKLLIERLWQLVKLILISIATYSLLFPATWVNPAQMFRGTIGVGITKPAFLIVLPFLTLIVIDLFFWKSKLATFFREKQVAQKVLRLTCLVLLILIGLLIVNMLAGMTIKDWIDTTTQNLLLTAISGFANSVNVVVFGLPEVILFGLIASLVLGFLQNKRFSAHKTSFVLVLMLWIFLMLGMAMQGGGVGFRYQILMMPLFSLVTSITIVTIFNEKKVFHVLIVVLSFGILLTARPFYLQDFNSFNTQKITPIQSWGFGGYELAQTMNSLPAAEKIAVWSDREGFNTFFVGKTYWRGRSNPFAMSEKVDYLILTRRGEEIFTSAANHGHAGGLYHIVGDLLINEYDLYNKEPDFKFCVTGKDCYKAVSVKDLIKYD